MNIENEHSKEKLLADIEKLIAYGRDEPTINPALLEYLSLEDLINTKAKLLERVGTLSEEDKVWLEQFKKGEVTQDTKKPLISEIGDEHTFDLSLTEGVYSRFGIVTGMIDKIVDFVWGPGFFTISKDSRAKEIIDQWMEDVDFGSHGRKWLKEALIKGTGIACPIFNLP